MADGAEIPSELNDYHHQYLSDAKNPGGYCNIGPNSMSCPIGVASAPSETQ